MNRFLIGTALLVAVLAAVVVLAPSFIDWNFSRAYIAKRVESALGYPVEIGGDIDFAILPSPKLSVRDVRVVNQDADATPAVTSLQSLDVQLAFGPLLRGEFQLRHVVLQDPKLNLEVLPDGRTNWNFAQALSAYGGPAVTIDNFVVRGGTVTVTYSDPLRGIAIVLEDVEAVITAESLTGPFDARGRFKYKEVPLNFTAASGALGSGRPAGIRLDLVLGGPGDHFLFRGTHSVQDGAWALRGDFILEGEDFATTAQMVATKLDMAPPVLHGLDAPYKLTATAAVSPTEAKLVEIDLVEIDVSLADMDATGGINVALGDAPYFDAAFTLTQVDLDSLLPRGEAEQRLLQENPDQRAQFKIPGNIAGVLTVSAEAMSYRGRLIRGANFTAKMADGAVTVSEIHALLPGLSEITGTGTLTAENGAPQFDGPISLQSKNLRELLAWLDIDPEAVPQDRLNTLNYTGHFRLSPGRVKVNDFEAGFDATRVTGSIDILLRERLELNLNAEFDRLNLDSYWVPPASDVAGEEVAPFPLSILNTFDTDIYLRADELTVRGEQLADLLVSVKLNDGGLMVRELSVKNMEGASGLLSGWADGFPCTVALDGIINIAAKDPGSPARLVGVPLWVVPERLGKFTFKAKLVGDRNDLKVDMGALLGGADLRVEGRVRRLGRTPDVDLDFSAEHPNAATLLEIVLDLRALSPEFGGGRGSISLGSLWSVFDGCPNQPVRESSSEFGDGAPAPVIGAAVEGVRGAVAGDGALDLRGKLKGEPDELAIDLTGELAGANMVVYGTFGVVGKLGPRRPRSYNFHFLTSHEDGTAYLENLGVPYNAPAPLGNVSLRASVEGGTDRIAVTGLEMRVAGMGFKGTGELRHDGPRRKLVADINAGDIDLDRLLALSEQRAAVRPSRPDWSGWPIPFDVLTAIDLEARFAADGVRLAGLDLDVPNFEAELSDGHLVLDPIHAGLYGGKLEARVEVNAGEIPSVQVKAELEEVDLARAPQVPWAFFPVSGSAFLVRADLNLTAEGESERELMSSLDGKLVVSAEGGRLAGLSFARLAAAIEAVADVANLPTLLQGAVAGGETEFVSLNGEATVSDGVVTFETLTAEVDGALLSGQGTVELPRRRTSLDFTVVLVDRPELPPFAMEVAGPWTAPRKSIRSRDLQGWVARRIGDAALREIAPAAPVAVQGIVGEAVEGVPGAVAGDGALPAVGDGAPAPMVGEAVEGVPGAVAGDGALPAVGDGAPAPMLDLNILEGVLAADPVPAEPIPPPMPPPPEPPRSAYRDFLDRLMGGAAP